MRKCDGLGNPAENCADVGRYRSSLSSRWKDGCSSNMIMSGANGNVIMSGWGDDNPDNARREATRRNTTSVSKRADRGASRTGAGSKRTAVLPDQSPGGKGRSQGSGSWQPWTAV